MNYITESMNALSISLLISNIVIVICLIHESRWCNRWRDKAFSSNKMVESALETVKKFENQWQEAADACKEAQELSRKAIDQRDDAVADRNKLERLLREKLSKQ